MSNGIKSYGLTTQLLIPMLALVVVMGIFIFSWSFYLSKSTLENEFKIEIAKTESLIDLALEDTLEDIKDDLIAITHSLDFKKAMAAEDRKYIDQRLYDFMSSRRGYLLDALTIYKDGHDWIEAGIIELPIAQVRRKFEKLEKITPLWNYLSFSSFNSLRTVLVCSVPILHDVTGKIVGVLYGGIDLNSNVAFIERLKKVSAASDGALLSQKKLVISTSSPNLSELGQLIKWGKSASSGGFKVVGDNIYAAVELMSDHSDSPLIFTFSRLNPVFKSLKKNYMKNLLILLSIAAFLAVFAAWALQKRILTALIKLTAYANSVSSEERGMTFENGQVREFNQLGETLENMVARLDEKSIYITSLFSSAKAPIINCDLDGVILDMNPAAQDLVLFSNEKMHGNLVVNFFPVEFTGELEDILRQTASEKKTQTIEMPVFSEFATEKYFIWTVSPVQVENSTDVSFILLQGQDVTENKLVMKKARESESRLRQIIDLLPHDIYANDMDGRFLLVNGSKAEKIGYSALDITGKKFADVIHDSIEVNNLLADDKLVLARGEKLLTEESSLDEKRDIQWIETTRVPYISAENNRPAILTISMDITRIRKAEAELQSLNKELVERVAMRTAELESANDALMRSMNELRRTQDKLVETEKMASLGELVAGVAHEINTPLGISLTSASFMKEMLENISDSLCSGNMRKSDLDKFLSTGSEAINSIIKNLERSARLVSSFKQLAVDQASDDVRQINLNEYMQGILMSLHSRIREFGHDYEVECPGGLEIFISPGALMQVVSNLVSNSLAHAFAEGETGHLFITVTERNNEILLRFADDGAGMSPEQVAKVFEPFYTTARSSGKAGLGMHLVYNLVTRVLKGHIDCSSIEGEGTVYEISFPVNGLESNG